MITNLQMKTTKISIQLTDGEGIAEISPYPIDMSQFLHLLDGDFDAAGVPYQLNPAGYHPTTIVQYALAHWNQYCMTGDEHHRNVFLKQSKWMLEHEVQIGDAGGWPIPFPHPVIHTHGSWLSASTQGWGISLLVRAYQITHEKAFLDNAHRAARTFELDILDGGVNTPIGESGIFFQEVAVYPATYNLNGFIFALIGLYEYVALIDDAKIRELIQRSLSTMHLLLKEFDVGFWTRTDLLHYHLASPDHLDLQITLLEALATYSGCEHCSTLAAHWKNYRHQFVSRLHYSTASCWSRFSHALLSRIQAKFFPKIQALPFVRACVAVPAFPVTGGVFTVLDGIAQVTKDIWQIEYLTHQVGSHPEGYVIHRFGTARMGYWQFPIVWLHVLAGFRKLISLMHQGAGYHVILPQDGVFTAAFAALTGKLVGVRVVCIDHGHLTLLKSRAYRAERIQALATRKWLRRLLSRLLYIGYWPSFSLLARIATPFVDHYFIPGIVGDGLEEICEKLGVPQSRITRFANMINMDRHVIPDAVARTHMREKMDIAADAIVITMICRLAIEKGLDIAVEAINQALSVLSPMVRSRIRVVIAGDGSMRKLVEEDVRKRGQSQSYMFLGEVSTKDVPSILAISDIFLYTSRRGVGYPLAILEAMASGCSVVASSVPLANSHMLDEGRGIVVPVGDAERTAAALIQLINDPILCRQIGSRAREYVVTHHGSAQLRRALMRVTYWSAFDEILDVERK